jgi:hypothetical protein
VSANEWSAPAGITSWACGSPCQDEVPDLREPRPAVGNPDVQDGPPDPPGVLSPETPMQLRGYVGGEEGVGVSFDLAGPVRKVPLRERGSLWCRGSAGHRGHLGAAEHRAIIHS